MWATDSWFDEPSIGISGGPARVSDKGGENLPPSRPVGFVVRKPDQKPFLRDLIPDESNIIRGDN